jgi:hypothetical protein
MDVSLDWDRGGGRGAVANSSSSSEAPTNGSVLVPSCPATAARSCIIHAAERSCRIGVTQSKTMASFRGHFPNHEL